MKGLKVAKNVFLKRMAFSQTDINIYKYKYINARTHAQLYFVKQKRWRNCRGEKKSGVFVLSNSQEFWGPGAK